MRSSSFHCQTRGPARHPFFLRESENVANSRVRGGVVKNRETAMMRFMDFARFCSLDGRASTELLGELARQGAGGRGRASMCVQVKRVVVMNPKVSSSL
jgi:hypothetical protein